MRTVVGREGMRGARAGTSAVAYGAIVATNLVAVAGVLIWHWQAREVLLLYGAEILVAGVFGALRIATADTGADGRGPPTGWGGKLLCALLSIALWGPFWYGYLLCLAVLFPAEPSHEGDLKRLILVAGSDPVIVAGLVVMLCQHAWLFFGQYLGTGENRGVSIAELVVDPLRRLIVTQAFVIVAITVCTVQGTTTLLIVPFILIRIGVELYLEGRDGLGNPKILE
jgi:hypothetical protein